MVSGEELMVVYYGDCYCWLERAQTYLDIARRRHKFITAKPVEMDVMAHLITLATEACCKHLLCLRGIDYLGIEGFWNTAGRCFDENIELPRAVTNLCNKMIVWEAQAMYAPRFEVKREELMEAFTAISEWQEKLYGDFIDEALARLEGFLPPALVDSYDDRTQLVVDNIELLGFDPKY